MDDDILQEFLTESWENVSRLDAEIVELEKSPERNDLLANIFYTIHTIKSACEVIGLRKIEAVAHSAENILGWMRSGELDISPDAISIVREAIDEIRHLLECLEATGEEELHDVATIDHLARITTELQERISFAKVGGTVECKSIPSTGVAVATQGPLTLASSSSRARASQREILRLCFERLAPHANQLARQFYERLLARVPELQSRFRPTDWPDQYQWFIQALLVLTKSLETSEALSRFFRELGRRHAEYGVTARHYVVGLETLLDSLREMSGDHWTAELESAWRQALVRAADFMLEGLEGTVNRRRDLQLESTSTGGL